MLLRILCALYTSSVSDQALHSRQVEDEVEVDLQVEVKLRPKISRPIYLGVGLPSGAHDQIFVLCLTIAGSLLWVTFSDERMGL
jgi:hypothetical protein